MSCLNVAYFFLLFFFFKTKKWELNEKRLSMDERLVSKTILLAGFGKTERPALTNINDILVRNINRKRMKSEKKQQQRGEWQLCVNISAQRGNLNWQHTRGVI